MADIGQASDALIPPEALKRFLAAHRWSIVEDRRGEWEVWRSPQDLHAQTVTLVFDDEYVDYETRRFEANQAILAAYDFTLLDLSERITSLSADLFFFRIEQESVDGTIPFKQAQRALDSIATMVRAAATTVASPAHSHRGRRPKEVDQFLAEDLRLGHTKKGSFVVTAAARFDEGSTPAVLPAPVNSDADSEQIEVDVDDATPDAEAESPVTHTDSQAVEDIAVPFSRRVMTTFSKGLAAARGVATDETPVGTAVEDGLSLELAEALEKISGEEGLQTIEVTFDWSEAIPQRQADVPQVVRFERGILDSLPRVAEALQIREPATEVEIVGPVVALSREVPTEGDVDQTGEVTIRADIDGRFRKVIVELDGDEHEWAIRAYREHFPVIVTGELVKRRSWRLEGYVSLDVEAARQIATRSSRRSAPHGEAVAPVDPEEDAVTEPTEQSDPDTAE